MTNATDILTRLRTVLKVLEGVPTNPEIQDCITDMLFFARQAGQLEELIDKSPEVLIAAAFATQLLERAAEAYVSEGSIH